MTKETAIGHNARALALNLEDALISGDGEALRAAATGIPALLREGADQLDSLTEVVIAITRPKDPRAAAKLAETVLA